METLATGIIEIPIGWILSMLQILLQRLLRLANQDLGELQYPLAY
jgi:hypothetical protein